MSKQLSRGRVRPVLVQYRASALRRQPTRRDVENVMLEAALAAVLGNRCPTSGLVHCPQCDMPIDTGRLVGPVGKARLLHGEIPGHQLCCSVGRPSLLEGEHWECEWKKDEDRREQQESLLFWSNPRLLDSYFEWVEQCTDDHGSYSYPISHCPQCDLPFDPLHKSALRQFTSGRVPGHDCTLEKK